MGRQPSRPASRGRSNPRNANGARRRALCARVAARGEPCWICGHPIPGGLPRGDPLALQVDELVPVSRGGSPYDPANCVAAHACCNNWRKAKPVGAVRQVQALVSARFGATLGPLDFVAKARAVARLRGPVARGHEAPQATTDW